MPDSEVASVSQQPPTNRRLTIVQALREALSEEMRANPDVFVMGEDIRIGGSFLFTLGLADKFGPERVLDTPISEAGFIGLAIGAAIQGMRPVVDFQYGDFIFCAMDQIVQQAAKLRYMSGGQVKIPLVLQLPSGASGRGAQHANSIETFFFGVPGLKIVTPATPYDAKGLLRAAINDDNTVLFCVHKHLYGSKGRPLSDSALSIGHVPEEPYTIDLGVADIKKDGSDVTVVANSQMLHRSLAVATQLETEGVSVEVIDPRTLVPFDVDCVLKSVDKTGRLLIVEEGQRRGGWGGFLAAEVADHGFGSLDAPIRRLAGPDSPIPFSPPLEASVIPSEARIRAEVLALLQ